MLEVKNLDFSYSGTRIFTDFNFSPNTNFSVIKGPSGCGKTTLLKLISGNLVASGGSIVGEKKAAIILQEDGLLPWMTGLKNIELLLPISVGEITDHVLYPHIQEFIDRNVYQMSYGQRRIVELFRIALLKPHLLCLDEPFNYLDPVKRDIFLRYFLKSTDFSNSTIVMSTHYTEDVGGFNLETYYFDGQFPIRRLVLADKFIHANA